MCVLIPGLEDPTDEHKVYLSTMHTYVCVCMYMHVWQHEEADFVEGVRRKSRSISTLTQFPRNSCNL
jgi:hypothetical protein